MTFLSDFGLADEYVAVCKAVMRNIARQVEVFDISHLIRPYGIREGATVLAEAVGYFPDAVHLAVVEPGVGSSRRPVVLTTASGSLLVGPDNGLLPPAADVLGGIVAAREIVNLQYGLPTRSSTFHGRDVFAPAAAHLAAGVPPLRMGPSVEPGSLIRLALPEVERLGDHFRGEVLLVDRFGNVQTSFWSEQLRALGLGDGDAVELEVSGARVRATVRKSYAFGPPGELQLVEDSHGNLALSVNRGNASGLLGEDAVAGSTVLLGKPGFAG